MPWCNMRASTDYKGVHYIHPLKQKQVEDLICELAKYEQIKGAIIFGSATKDRCTPVSDIDVLLIGEPCYFVSPRNGEVYDILWAKNLSRGYQLVKEIERDGVLVYEA